VSAAQAAFAEFIQAGTLAADQMTFINNIITYLTKNGIIDKQMLFEAPLPISMIRDWWGCLMMPRRLR